MIYIIFVWLSKQLLWLIGWSIHLFKWIMLFLYLNDFLLILKEINLDICKLNNYLAKVWLIWHKTLSYYIHIFNYLHHLTKLCYLQNMLGTLPIKSKFNNPSIPIEGLRIVPWDTPKLLYTVYFNNIEVKINLNSIQ